MLKKIIVILLIQMAVSTVLFAQTDKNVHQKADSSIALNDQQIKFLTALKEDGNKSVAAISLKLADVIKQSNDNILSDKPDTLLNNKLSIKVSQAISDLIGNVTRNGIKASSILTPKQRAYVKKEAEKPNADGDVLETILRVFNIDKKN
jgi:hypothetical protein